jgi:hypothetical protein
VIVAHVAGFPLEETVAQFAPVGAVAVTVGAVALQTQIGRVRSGMRRLASVVRREYLQLVRSA